MKTVVLAEKPSVGRELARVLGCTNKQKGFSEGKQYIVTWAMGHLVELAGPEVYDQRYKTWSLETLPIIPEKMRHKVIGKTSKQFNTIKKLFARNDTSTLVIATDAGREGELVARWIMRLGGWKGNVKRLWISSQTDKAIKQGFSSLEEGKAYENLFRAAEARAEADWLIGINITRALSCKYDVRLSAGRVQTPTLTLIAEREKEIQEFTPQAYWTVTADFGVYEGLWRGEKGGTRLKDQNRAREIAGKVENGTGTITEVRVKEKKNDPPLAYDLTSLQGDANRILGFSAKKTLQTLQNLYERHKIVTYPRTDSRHITKDMVPTLKERLLALNNTPFRGIVQSLLTTGTGGSDSGGAGSRHDPLKPGKRFVDDSKVSDHHAVIPTEEKVNLDRLSGDERSLWQLVARRFLEVLSPPFRYKQISIITEVNGESFVTNGRKVLDYGWKSVGGGFPGGGSAGGPGSSSGGGATSDDETSDDEAVEDLLEQNLGEHKKGETHEVISADVKQGWTKPPKRYTEGTLLGAMENAGKFIDEKELKKSIEKGGLGTPATRADIIEKIISNYYVVRQGKELAPTSRGLELLELVPEKLKSPKLTATWELRLSRIAEGEEKRELFLRDIRDETKKTVHQVKTSTAQYTPKGTIEKKCPLCGRPLYPVRGKRGKNMLVCQGLSCGYEEQEGGSRDSKPSEKEKKIARRLMKEYGDNSKETATFADLIKAAQERKNG